MKSVFMHSTLNGQDAYDFCELHPPTEKIEGQSVSVGYVSGLTIFRSPVLPVVSRPVGTDETVPQVIGNFQ